MSANWVDDIAMRALRLGLDGLSTRQQVISNNLANVDTPGYQAQTVRFKEAMHRVLEDQGGLSLRTTNARHLSTSSLATPGFTFSDRQGGSMRTDGNNVDIDVELVEMSETGIQYQALTQLASKKLMLLKTIATSR